MQRLTLLSPYIGHRCCQLPPWSLVWNRCDLYLQLLFFLDVVYCPQQVMSGLRGVLGYEEDSQSLNPPRIPNDLIRVTFVSTWLNSTWSLVVVSCRSWSVVPTSTLPRAFCLARWTRGSTSRCRDDVLHRGDSRLKLSTSGFPDALQSSCTCSGLTEWNGSKLLGTAHHTACYLLLSVGGATAM